MFSSSTRVLLGTGAIITVLALTTRSLTVQTTQIAGADEVLKGAEKVGTGSITAYRK